MAGLARFRGSELVETWRVLVDPEDHYEQLYHSDLHGIREQHTSEASTFPEIHPLLKHFLAKELCIFHAASGFDRECLRKACERYALENVTTSAWLSTLELAHEQWPQEAPYKLERLCENIGHDYLPHNALEDTIAAAAVFRSLSGSTPFVPVMDTIWLSAATRTK